MSKFKRIKKIAASKGMTIADLAKKMSIHTQSLRRIISSGNTTKETLDKLLEALNIQESELYNDGDGKVIISAIDEKHWRILKIITMNIPTKHGAQDLAYIMYKRSFTPYYKIIENKEPHDWLGEYPKQKDYPSDEIDALILKAIQDKYPLSKLRNKLILFNFDVDNINTLTNLNSEEGKITLTPFITPEAMCNNSRATYYKYEIPINIYLDFPIEHYTKYFTATFNINIEEKIHKQHCDTEVI